MSFAAPGILWLTGLIMLGTVIAHLFSRSRPRDMVFPTARFLPEGAVRAPTRAPVPTDLALLAVRLAIVALVGIAFARPNVEGRAPREVVRMFAVDVSSHLSRDASARSAVLDSIGALHREGDVIVTFDTAVRRVTSLDSLFSGAAATTPGSLSAGLLGALRTAAASARLADSVELVLVSPIHVGEIDSASMAIRALWPGRIRVIRSPGQAAPTVRASVEVVAPGNDPIRETVALAGGFADTEVRVVRTAVTSADSAWATGANRVLIAWPARTAAPTTAIDTVGAVVAAGRVVVATFERVADGGRGSTADAAGERVVARWLDGAPAATETAHAAGCIRSVSVPVPSAGDLAIRWDFVLFVRELLAPCGGARGFSPASNALVEKLAGEGPLATVTDITPSRRDDPTLAAWMLIAALMLALVEHLLRRRASEGTERMPELVGDSMAAAGAGRATR